MTDDVAPHHAADIPWRLLEAFARGEVTKGGMAEAGWFHIGTITEDSKYLTAQTSGSGGPNSVNDRPADSSVR